jgi:DNA-binding MarR family transcriptional regulator
MKLEEAIQTNQFKDALHKASLNILYTAWWLKTIMTQELKQFGLTHEQYNVMRILKGKNPAPMCIKDIASRMIEKNSNVPRIIDRLVVKKLVKRTTDPQDKRHTVITLTPAGLNILQLSTLKIEDVIGGKIALEIKDAENLNELLELFRVN